MERFRLHQDEAFVTRIPEWKMNLKIQKQLLSAPAIKLKFNSAIKFDVPTKTNKE